MTADVLALVLRTLGFIGLFQAAGAIFFLLLFGSLTAAVRARVRVLAMISAGVALVCLIAQQSLEAARFVGELAGVLDPEWLRAAWSSTSGAGQAVRVLGLVLIVAGCARVSPRGSIIASAGAVLALLSFLVSGHTSVHSQRVVLAPLLALHVFVAAFWFGSLLPLYLLIRHDTNDRTAAVLERFSRTAGYLVPLILAAGVLMLCMLAPNVSVLERPYGELLLVKLAVFTILMLLAAYNRWRLVPRLVRSTPVGAVLRRSIATEVVLIGAVLAVTAALTLFFSPEA